MTEDLVRKMVSEDGFDLCVSCSTKTAYKTEAHIDARRNYIEGAGQLCGNCYETLEGIKK